MQQSIIQMTLLCREEFNKNGLSDRIIVEHRDVCNNGFPDGLKVDAVFLDLPRPWIAIEHAKKTLKNGGKICTFSPCIEQVQNNVKTINSLGFTRIFNCIILNSNSYC